MLSTSSRGELADGRISTRGAYDVQVGTVDSPAVNKGMEQQEQQSSAAFMDVEATTNMIDAELLRGVGLGGQSVEKTAMRRRWRYVGTG